MPKPTILAAPRHQIDALVKRPLSHHETCSYCGKQYPDDAELCEIDQKPLVERAVSPTEDGSFKVTCPHCRAADDYTRLVEARTSFSIPALAMGGIVAVIFRNASRPRRVRCNQCAARYYISNPLTKLSQLIFWLLISPAIILLVKLIRCLFYP